MKFLHISDVHLGCRRYSVEERMKDFARAWRGIVENVALPEAVDFVVIAGDFFDRRNVEPQAMNHAMASLLRLKEAGIPVIVIEGNHDQRDMTSDHSWLRALASWGYIILLEPVYDAESGAPEFVEWDEETRRGSYIDIAGARTFGSNWYGATAAQQISRLTDALRDARAPELFNILLLHTDVEGQLNRAIISAIPVAKLKELQQAIDYLALGHTHKRFEIDNWAFNPGSLEAVAIDEYREERGAYLVSVEADKTFTAQHITEGYFRRPFQRIAFDVSGATDPEVVHAGVRETVAREARKFTGTHGNNDNDDAVAPIVEMTLRGHLGFKNSLLDLRGLRDEIKDTTGALHVIMRNQSVPVEYAVAVGLEANAPRHERERRIIEDLIMRDNRFRHRAGDVAELVIEAKRLALGNESPDKIVELIAQKLDAENTVAEPMAEMRATTEEPVDVETVAITEQSSLAFAALEKNAAEAN